LPDEIIEAQKVRSDLLKWKLCVDRGPWRGGFGLMEKVSPAPLLLALIPLVPCTSICCASNLNLRQVRHSAPYFRSARQDAYETFVHDHPPGIRSLRTARSTGPTMTVCLLVAIVGAAFKRPEKVRHPGRHAWPGIPHTRAAIGNVLITSGVLDLLVSVLASGCIIGS